MPAEAGDPPYTVVVGVSSTSRSPAALVWAAAQAEANHGRLVAVRVLKRAPEADRVPSYAEAQAALEADVADALGPDHQAECRVLHGGKRKSLLAAARSADLLVIDTARSPSSSSMLSHRIVSAATCPVVILPPALNSEPESRISQAGRAAGESALRAVGTSGRAGYRPPERT